MKSTYYDFARIEKLIRNVRESVQYVLRYIDLVQFNIDRSAFILHIYVKLYKNLRWEAKIPGSPEKTCYALIEFCVCSKLAFIKP